MHRRDRDRCIDELTQYLAIPSIPDDGGHRIREGIRFQATDFRQQVSAYTSTNCRALQHSAAGMAGPPAWLLGVVASVAALSVLGDDFGLFTSLTGAMYAALGAFWFGAGLAALLDARHGGRNAVIVALSVAALVIVYIGVAFTRVPPPGSTGGPNVLPP